MYGTASTSPRSKSPVRGVIEIGPVNGDARASVSGVSTADVISTWWDKQTATETDQAVVLGHNPGLEHRHSDWDETSEYFGFCNFGWGQALQKLKQVCETQ